MNQKRRFQSRTPEKRKGKQEYQVFPDKIKQVWQVCPQSVRLLQKKKQK